MNNVHLQSIKTHHHKKYFENLTLPTNIYATTSFNDVLNDDILQNTPLFICSIPVQSMREFLTNFSHYRQNFNSHKKPLWVLCSKGIEISSCLFPSQIIKSIFPDDDIGVLSGPNFAVEIAQNLPATGMLACSQANKDIAFNIISKNTYRLYHTENIKAVEICGAMKNVIAIACGIAKGKNLGDNAHASLMSRGLNEILSLCNAFAPSHEIIHSVAGIGDLALSCFNQTSRNMQFGYYLSQDISIQQALDKSNGIVEGLMTVKPLINIAHNANIDLPITHEINQILHYNKAIDVSISDLLSKKASQ